MTAFLASLFFVVLAEMGDKTQLLAMAFAARYRATQVLWAVFLATAVNHALAVVVGRLLTKVVPFDTITLVAAASFIIFGLWTLRGDTLANGVKRESKFGPVATVAIAFFLAEMGDKTQLATISLAIEYRNTLGVLLGTTTGMVIADAVGIMVGIVMKKHIPENVVKWISAVVFMLFGFTGIFKIISSKLSLFPVLSIMSGVVLGAFVSTYLLVRKKDKSKVRAGRFRK
ncbi:MAG: TMEM165/GDT1 family protein [Candidatus Omnitrophica bacterium]|nr:TMEM165/GDT1 family protein [Candidatus Omnitrophota bacterium]